MSVTKTAAIRTTPTTPAAVERGPRGIRRGPAHGCFGRIVPGPVRILHAPPAEELVPMVESPVLRKPALLVVEDDRLLRWSLREKFRRRGGRSSRRPREGRGARLVAGRPAGPRARGGLASGPRRCSPRGPPFGRAPGVPDRPDGLGRARRRPSRPRSSGWPPSRSRSTSTSSCVGVVRRDAPHGIMAAMARSRILVVDDEQLIRWTLRERLEEAGYAVVEAETGTEALASSRTRAPISSCSTSGSPTSTASRCCGRSATGTRRRSSS